MNVSFSLLAGFDAYLLRRYGDFVPKDEIELV